MVKNNIKEKVTELRTLRFFIDKGVKDINGLSPFRTVEISTDKVVNGIAVLSKELEQDDIIRAITDITDPDNTFDLEFKVVEA
jgi:hypothetical protein